MQAATVSLVTRGLQIQHTESLKQCLDTFPQPAIPCYKLCACAGATEAAVSVGIPLLLHHLYPSSV